MGTWESFTPQGYTQLRDHGRSLARLIAVGHFVHPSRQQIERCMSRVEDDLFRYKFRVWQERREYDYMMKYC